MVRCLLPQLCLGGSNLFPMAATEASGGGEVCHALCEQHGAARLSCELFGHTDAASSFAGHTRVVISLDHPGLRRPKGPDICLRLSVWSQFAALGGTA